MSTGNDMSTAETAQSDQYFTKIQQHQQQQQVYLPQQHYQPEHQQLQSSQSHCQRSNNKIMWMSANNTEAELNNGYWQQQQNNPYNNHYQPQPQQPQQQHKTFLMPEDIPPPPPQPKLKNGVVKRLQCERIQQQQQPQQRKQQLQHQHLSNCSFEQHAYDIQQQPQEHHHHHQYQHHHQQQPMKQQKLQQQQQQQQQQQPLAHCQQHNHLQQQQHQQLLELPAAQQQHQQQPAHFHDCLLKNHHQHHQQHQHQQQQQYPHKYHSNLVVKEQQQNLMYEQKKIRKLRLSLGILFTIVVIGVLTTALVFIFKDSDDDNGPFNPDAQGTAGIKLEDVLSGHLQAKRFNGSWSTGTNILYRINNSIVEYDVKAGHRTVLMYDERQQYVLSEKSADGQYLLLVKNHQKNFRFSYLAQYDVYNIETSQIQPLLIDGDPRFFALVQWAPVGCGLVINYNRNLYYKPNPSADAVQLTHDDNIAIFNGVPDWVYEEEVFSSNSAVWFNPNGTQIAFMRFDDTPTHLINFPYYGEAGDLNYQYPFSRTVAYPKAGSSNPHVKLFTANLTRAVQGLEYLTEVPVPSPLNTETDIIISVVEWLDNEEVLSVWMNRIQNLAYLQVFDGLKRYLIYSMESKHGWIDLFSPPFKNRDGSQIALILPQPQDDGNNYKHLCLLSTRNSNGKPEVLTKGKFEIDHVLYWDPSNDIIFYTANTVDHSEVMHLYAIKAATGQTSKCLTCSDQMSGATKQSYISADFNSDHQIIINTLGPGIPTTTIYEWQWSDNKVTLKKLMDWESNTRLRNELAKIAMPQTEIHNVPISNGFTAKVLLQLPPNMDRSGKTKYPMLVDVYGGPDTTSVTNKWTMDWGTYLSSNQSVIYAKIDGRGSGLRGENLLHSIYLKLGTVEITDQIDVTRYLQNNFPFIDASHTGIWGWSYGGYAAAMALANDENSRVFKCAASIAPVTDWAYYDSIYTERFMALPKDNPIGYENSRLSTRALMLKGKKYLLVHGTLDDNVHYQQAMILAKNLERHDILFKQISYTDEDHALANVRPHLYHSLDRFFGECFESKRLMGTANK